MGAIEDIYADLEADVSEDEFREAVEAKVEQMGGLADEETAAMLVAHELADTEVSNVADVEPEMREVKFLAKVLSVGELRTFERDDGETGGGGDGGDGGDDDTDAEAAEGRVINVEAADETGTVRLAFWDERAQAVADGELAVGDVLRIKGRPKEGYNGLEVSVDQAEVDDEVEIDVEPGGSARVETLTLGQSDVTLTGLVLGTEEPRTFDRDDGSEGKVANLTLGDETGRIRVTLWDERADRATEIEPGTAVEVVDGYVRERDGDLELHVGDRGAVEEIDETVEYAPDTTPIAEVELDDEVDVAGVVRSADPKRTFDRDDGSEGQVRNVRLQDATGDIRVALWGDLADVEIAPGDEVLAADVEIQDGWQDDLEASAGWRSTVVVLEDAATDVSVAPGAGGAESGGAESEGAQSSGAEGGRADAAGGLAAFADEESEDADGVADGSEATGDGATGDGATESASGSAESASEPTESTGDAGSGGAVQTTEGEVVEFTGTVVQTGDPAILDDGTETMTVETDETLGLGEEVTARGEVREGRLQAEEIL